MNLIKSKYLDTNINNLPAASGVYIIICVANNKKYVGRAKNIRRRVEQELRDMVNSTIETAKNKKMKIDFDKYGADKFKYFVLQECNNELSIYLEDYYIRKYNCINNGYNSKHGDLKSVIKDDKIFIKEYFYEEVDVVDNEYRWIMNKIDLNLFNKDSMLLHISLEEFIKQFRLLFYKDVTIEIINEVMIIMDFPVCIFDSLREIYYEISAKEFKSLYNNDYSYHIKLIEDKLISIVNNQNIKNVSVGINKYKITNELIQFVKDYNKNIFQEESRLNNKKRMQDNEIKNKAENLKRCIETDFDIFEYECINKEYIELLQKRRIIEDEIDDLRSRRIDEIILSIYNIGSIDVFKSFNTVIKL